MTGISLTAIVAGAALAAGLVPDPDAHIGREGEGERRAALDAMEARPCPADLLAGLSDWANGEPLTPEAIQGRVLLLMTLDNAEASSIRYVPFLKRLEDRYGESGLLVVGVHHPERWDGLMRRVEEGRVQCRVAHDADGAVRERLLVDDDPDAYLIDRAGQLRFADVAVASIERAVRALLAESAEEAAGALERREAAAAARPAPAEQASERTNSAVAQAVAAVPAEAYQKARWPAPNPAPAEALYALNVQGRPLPVPLGNETWLSETKPDLTGRVIVLDFWATWCGPCRALSPSLDALQRKHPDDLVVIAVSGQSAGTRYPEDEKAIRAYMKQHPTAYAHAHDPLQRVYRSLQIRGIPHCVVLSTDGVVRWQGFPGTNLQAFEQTIASVIEADPGVAARRGAEAGG